MDHTPKFPDGTLVWTPEGSIWEVTRTIPFYDNAFYKEDHCVCRLLGSIPDYHERIKVSLLRKAEVCGNAREIVEHTWDKAREEN